MGTTYVVIVFCTIYIFPVASQVGGLFLAEKAGQDARPLVLAANRRLVLTLAGTLAGPLSAAGRHRQRGRPVRHRRSLFERIDVRVHCRAGAKKKNNRLRIVQYKI